MTTDTDTKQDTIQRPARAWRNWYRHRTSGAVVVSDRRSYATEAEAKSADANARVSPAHIVRWEYLGAYPEGTRP